MVPDPKFSAVASHFETLVQEFQQSEDLEARKRLLLQMSRDIKKFDAFVRQYLDSIGLEPATKAQQDAVLFARQVLNKARAATGG